MTRVAWVNVSVRYRSIRYRVVTTPSPCHACLTNAKHVSLRPSANHLLRPPHRGAMEHASASSNFFRWVRVLLRSRSRLFGVRGQVTRRLPKAIVDSISPAVSVVRDNASDLRLLLSRRRVVFFPTAPRHMGIQVFAGGCAILMVLPILLHVSGNVRPFHLTTPYLEV